MERVVVQLESPSKFYKSRLCYDILKHLGPYAAGMRKNKNNIAYVKFGKFLSRLRANRNRYQRRNKKKTLRIAAQ